MNDWRRTFAGSAARIRLLTRLSQVEVRLNRGDFDLVMPELFMGSWMCEVNLDGVPRDVIQHIRIYSEIGRRALLKQPPDVEEARAAIQRVRRAIV